MVQSERLDSSLPEMLLQGFERIRGLILEQEPFGVDNGLMTPTFKLKRHHLQVGSLLEAF